MCDPLVGLLVADVTRLHERIGKLETHFRKVGDDVADTLTSAEKILKRGERIDAMDLSEDAQQARPLIRAAE